MLDKFRDNARSWILQVVIGAIALVFIFSFGPGSRGCGAPSSQSGWAAKVDGEEVPASQFRQTLSQHIYIGRMRSGGEYGPDEQRRDNVRALAMKTVIDRELVAQAAERSGLWVGDDEVVETIREATQFHKNGRFDGETYRRYVESYLGLTPEKYEQQTRRELLVQRMLGLVAGSVTVSDEEVRAEFARRHEEATMDYVRFAPAQFREEASANDADAEKLLGERPDDVRKRYEETKYAYVQPRAVRARRLFAPVKPDASPAEEQAAKAKVEEAKAALDGGQKWETLAGDFTDDPAAEDAEGGIGWVSLGRSPFGKTLEETAFQLKPGETSAVVRDRFGFMVVQTLEDRPPTEKSFDDAKQEIALAMAREEMARTTAKQKAEETLRKLKAGETLAAQWPKAEGEGSAATLRPHTTSSETIHPFGGFIPGIGQAPKVSAALFALSAEKRVPDEVVEDSNAFYVFQLTSRARPEPAQFDAEKDALRENLVGQKQGEMQAAWVEQLRKQAKITENPGMLSYEPQALAAY